MAQLDPKSKILDPSLVYPFEELVQTFPWPPEVSFWRRYKKKLTCFHDLSITISGSFGQKRIVLFENRFVFLQSRAKSKEKLKTSSACGSAENKVRGTSSRYTVYMHIGNWLMTPLHPHLHKSRKNVWAQFWFLEKFLDLATQKSVSRWGPWTPQQF